MILPVYAKKRCTKCKEIQRLARFSKNKGTRDELGCWCRACRAQSRQSPRSKKGVLTTAFWKEHAKATVQCVD